jgi:hypothetical protein
MKKILTILVAILIASTTSFAQGVSEEWFEVTVTITDSSMVSSEEIIVTDAVNYALPSTGHALSLDGIGNPVFHIWSPGNPDNVFLGRFGRVEFQGGSWTGVGSEIDITPIFYYFSEDLEVFETYSPQDTLDGHALQFMDDGTIVNLTQSVEYLDSLDFPVLWTEWSIDYGNGEYENISLRDQYESLDIESYGTYSGPGGSILYYDALHGNSVDLKDLNSSTFFIGGTNRTIDEVLIMKDQFSFRSFFHFGGPLNEFTYLNDEVLSFKGHDLRFLEVAENTVLLSFFSNGDGSSIGGTYAAGKVVMLDLQNMTAELISQTILPGGLYSSAMGSYDSETGNFCPGMWMENGNNLSRVLSLDLDLQGNEFRRITHSQSEYYNSYQSHVYGVGSGAKESLLLPTLDLDCVSDGSEIIVVAEKLGLYDEFQFFVDGIFWTGGVLNGNEIRLPGDFSGEVSVMSRLEVSQHGFTVDKYSEIVVIPDDFCSIFLSDENFEEDDEFNFFWNKAFKTLVLSEEIGLGKIYSIQGVLVKQFTGSSASLDLSSGIYILETDRGFRRKFLID